MTRRSPKNQWDIILFADFARTGDSGFRISQEVRLYYAMGCRIGLVHLDGILGPVSVSPDVQMCVREGLVDVLAPEQGGLAKLALVYFPSSFAFPCPSLSRFTVDRVVLVHDQKPELKQVGRWLSFHIGEVIWAPTNRWVRGGLAALNLPIAITDADWRPIGRALRSPVDRSLDCDVPVIGRISLPGAAQWQQSAEEIKEIYPIAPGYDFRLIGRPKPKIWKSLKGSSNITHFEPGDISIQRFIELLDVFYYFPGVRAPAMPEAAIACAMASGKLVFLPPHLEPHFGPGAIFTEPTDAIQTLNELLADGDAVKKKQDEAVFYSGFYFSEEKHSQRVLDLLDRKTVRLRRKTAPESRAKQVLFVASNGVGMGHVARLLAIARRLDEQIEPVFVTMAQAVSVIQDFGYEAEYLPSNKDTQTNHDDWDAWFRHELEILIDRYSPAVVVYDGNNPTNGLIHAVMSRGSCRLVWVRRGMMRAKPSPYLNNSRFMDLIIEPGEIAGERDFGSTAARQNEALQVDPITLLDRGEFLDRISARRELQLAEEKPAVLLHLGGGATRDVVGLSEEIIYHLERIPDLQIVLAEWENIKKPLSTHSKVKILKGFPISRYLNAFDFSISAAGYNTYHEVLAAGLPTLFIANNHPSMDNQEGRAAFAQDHGAGFDISEDELFLLPALCKALLDKNTQSVIRENCEQLYQGNGANSAADAIMKLVEKNE